MICMKSLSEYIFEKIKNLPKNVSGIIVFDIDDTILKVDSSLMSIYKKTENGEKALSTDEFAKDPDAGNPEKSNLFDFRDFNDPTKVYMSIMKGTPLIKNLKIMDDYINAGYDFCFLTARGCEETVKTALDDFLKVRNRNGALEKLGLSFKKTISHAVNDKFKKYPGKSDSEKKAIVLKKLCSQYDKVVFVDDDNKNVNAARNLKISNLKVIKAWN